MLLLIIIGLLIYLFTLWSNIKDCEDYISVLEREIKDYELKEQEEAGKKLFALKQL